MPANTSERITSRYPSHGQIREGKEGQICKPTIETCNKSILSTRTEPNQEQTERGNGELA
jgi:hypothetical protein